jgi:hypothetical protein
MDGNKNGEVPQETSSTPGLNEEESMIFPKFLFYSTHHTEEFS